jgi:hypothetical protein
MAINSLTDKLIAKKFWGEEPIYKKAITSKNDGILCKMLNWYNVMSDEKDKDKWLTDYMKKNGYSKTDISNIVNLNSLGNIAKNSASVLARIESNGTIFAGELEGQVKSRIEKALSYNQRELKEDKSSAKVVSIQDRIKVLAEPHVIHIDDEIHSWYYERKTKIEFSLYTYLQRNQLNSQICNHIKTLVSKIHAEHAEMVEGKDEQLTEAYAYLPNASKKAIMKQLTSCMDDIERFVGNTKVSKPRKPRKKKEVTASKLINKLKYQKEFTKLKIKSISPESIVSAQQLWVYNTKYGHLTMLNAINDKGLSVKGTTIVDYDQTSSIKKKLRKPEDIIQKVLTGGKLVLKKLMSDLTTKPIEVNGRINDDCILLKSIK